MQRACFLLVVLLLPAAVLSQSEKQKIKIKQDITKVMNEQTVAWNRGDIDGFMTGYWRSDDLRFVSGSEVTRGWQTTLDRYKRNYSTREKMGSLTFSDLVIDVVSRDAAVVLGTWRLVRAADTPNGKFTLIFRKFSEGWRIVHDHTS